MKKTIQIIAAAALLSLSAHSFAGKTEEGGYIGDRTPKEKEICKRVWENYNGSRTICFFRGTDLVVGDVSATLEKLNNLKADSEEKSDESFWAHQRIKMIFTGIFNDPRLDLSSIDSVTTIAPRADLCRKMEKKTFMKIYGNSEYKAANEWDRNNPHRSVSAALDYLWDKSTIVPCPKAP